MKLTDWLISDCNKKNESTSEKENIIGDFEDSMPKRKDKEEDASHSRKSAGGAAADKGTTTTVNGTHSTKFKQELVLPQNKVKVIMKSSPEIDTVGADVLFLISKATEVFVDHVTTLTHAQAHKGKNIEYKHLADVTQKQTNMEFLRDIIPVKMLAKDALQEVAKQKAASHKELLGD